MMTSNGLDHPLMAGLPATLNVLQWHGQEVKQLPIGATLLASSSLCQVQAYAVGNCAFGLQFYSEVTDTTVKDWVKISAYRADLEVTLGSTGADDLKQAVNQHLAVMNREAKIVFNNFLKILESRYQQ
jgi:GMP synthase-like glutamine amidotransferase